MERIGYTIEMMKSSWGVLMKDKELLWFPLFSGIACVLVLLSFALPALALGLPSEEKMQQNPVPYYAILFLFYFVNYFIIIFFNSAVVACAIFRMRGGDPTLKTGFNASMARLPQIAGWAFVAATVGLILRVLENASKDKIGRFVIGLIGMAWSVITFLVVPILVVEKKGPIESIKESAALLKKTWGEQLVGNFSFGIIFFVLSILGIVPLILGVMMLKTSLVGGILLIAVGVVYLIAVALVQSTLQTIFQAAVYLYARDGRAPEGFPNSAMGSAMAQARHGDE